MARQRLLVGLSLALVVTFFAWRALFKQITPLELNGTRLKKPVELPDIPLDTIETRINRLSDYKGKWLLLFNGFTHCPDICAPSLAYLAKEYARLLELRPYVNVLFLSVDPEHDKPDTCAEFVKGFSREFHCAITDDHSLEGYLKVLGGYVEQPEDKPIAHSGDIYLINPDGKWEMLFRPPFAKDALADDVQKLIQRRM